MNQKAAISFLKFEDEIYKDPNSEPYVNLHSIDLIQPDHYKQLGIYGSYTQISTIMISNDLKERALDEIHDYSLSTLSGGYFIHEDGKEMRYETGETWEYNEGLQVEPLIVNRYWKGLNISFIEPTERLIMYLNLLRKNDAWINPYTDEEIIIVKTEERNESGVSYHLDKIEIKLDYLKDYLAARNSGLLFLKFSVRGLTFEDESEIPDLPATDQITNGTWMFESSKNVTEGTFGHWAEAEIRQQFWIDPLDEPRRSDAQHRGEFVGDVLYTLHDGTIRMYNVEAGHSGDYFKLISFKPEIMEVFTNRRNFDYCDYTKETIGFNFPDGESLTVAINPSGQIQSYWGLLRISMKLN